MHLVQPYTPGVRKAPVGGDHLCRGFSQVSAFAALLLATLAPGAFAQDAYVTNYFSSCVS